MADNSEIDDGGFAFPNPDVFRPDGQHAAGGHYGMSLRDWFAGQAVGAIISSFATDFREDGETIPQLFARKAYAIADAMLAERAKIGGDA